jgi:hypothetical protein
MAEAGESCGNCKYWLPFPSKPEGVGECRRHAPQPPGSESTKWPKTATADWCGEHESKRKAPRLKRPGFTGSRSS